MTLALLPLILCLGVSFFLSGMEAGLFALSRFRIRRLVREGHEAAQRLSRYLEHPEDFLWTILAGNTVANSVVVGLSLYLLHTWFNGFGLALWSVFIPGLLLFYVLCDLLPKMLFRLYPHRLCLIFLTPFRLVRFVLRPLIWLMAGASGWALRQSGRARLSDGLFGTREELRHVMQDSAQKMTSEERAMINRVLDLQTLTVGQVMVPLAKVVAVNQDTPVEQVLTLCRERDVTRLPVWRVEGGQRRVAGLLNARSLFYAPNLDPHRTAGEFLKPAVYLDDSRRLEDALRQLQRSGQRLAIVLDRQRKEIGVVSLHDILTVAFGEFHL
jgi:CBS domain containing-hemolysin-like protein